MAKNPRDPKAVKKLAAEAQARIDKNKPTKPPINGPFFTSASLWARIRTRKKGSGGQ